MSTDDLHTRVEREIVSLHEFFVDWFGGTLEEAAFETDFVPRFSTDLVFIPPAGRLLGYPELETAIRERYSTNPDFRIQIRNVVVHRHFAGKVLATYEEWQRNALASTPPDNGRLATVLFEEGERLRWLHIHETWLPEEVMASGPYDF